MVRTVNVGLTLLAVWDSENVGVADYVPLSVEHAIYPDEAQRLVVGDVICFAAHLSSPDGECGPRVSLAEQRERVFSNCRRRGGDVSTVFVFFCCRFFGSATTVIFYLFYLFIFFTSLSSVQENH